MAALAVFGLASCSSDDFFSNSANSQLEKKGDLVVEVEDMLDPSTMRSAFLPVEGQAAPDLYWQNGDKVRVFDETLGKYDTYTYNLEKGTFDWTKPLDSDRQGPAIKAPVYSLFSNKGTNETDAKLAWNEATDELYATYTIPTEWTWGEDKVSAGEGVLSYQSFLPLWGTAEAGEDGLAKASLHYLTGIIRLNLENVPGNADKIVVKGYVKNGASEYAEAVMTGSFDVVISKDGADPKENIEAVVINPKRVNAESVGQTGNTITVNLKNEDDEDLATEAKSVVLIPIIAQTYSKIDVEIYSGEEKVAGFSKPDPGRDNVKIERRLFYQFDVPAFDVAGGDVTALNKALDQRKDVADGVIIRTSHITNVKKDDFKLNIPAMKANKVTLQLKGLTTPLEDDQNLHIYSDAGFAGELVIDVAEVGYDYKNIYVDLPNAVVTFSGAGLQKVQLGGKNDGDNLKVKKLIIGKALDEKKPTSVWNVFVSPEVGTDNEGEDVIICEGTTLRYLTLKGTSVKYDEITIEGTIEKSAVDLSKIEQVVKLNVGNKANIVKGIVTKQTELTIPGQAKIGEPGDDQSSVTDVVVKMVNGGTVIVKGKAVDTTENGVANDSVRVRGAIEIVGEGSFDIQGSSKIHKLLATADEDGKQAATVTMTNDAQVMHIVAEAADVTLKSRANVVYNVTAKTVTLNNDASVNGTVTAETLNVKQRSHVRDAKVSGDVTIALTEEGEAVTGTLTMTGVAYAEKEGENPTLRLTGGYINAMTTDVEINISNKENNVPTAILKATDGDIKLVTDEETGATYTSTWAGKAITTDNTTYGKYCSTGNIYTASMLASMGAQQKNRTLYADMNLNNNPWTIIALNGDFDGQEHIIRNLTAGSTAAAAEGEEAVKNVGLFATVGKADATIKNLTIQSATVKGDENVGVLVGATTAAVTVQNVTIKGTVNVEAFGDNAGGVVGKGNTGIVSFDNVTAKTAKIVAKHNLGGLIGYGVSGVNVKDCANKVVPDFTVTGAIEEPKYAQPETADDDAGSVGVYVGRVKYLTVDAKHAATDKLKGKRKALGFKGHFDFKDKQWYAWYGSATGDVGIVENGGNYTITGGDQTVAGEVYDTVDAIVGANAYNAFVKDNGGLAY